MKASIAALLTFIALCCVASAEWNIENPTKEASQELEGTIFGRPFTLGEATWDDMTLTLSSKDKVGSWPASELIFFIKDRNEKSEWFVTPETNDFGDPHVHMKFGKEGKDFPGTLIFMEEYSLYLKVLEKTDSTAKIQIHVSLPDYKKSTLIGVFEAKIEE